MAPSGHLDLLGSCCAERRAEAEVPVTWHVAAGSSWVQGPLKNFQGEVSGNVELIIIEYTIHNDIYIYVYTHIDLHYIDYYRNIYIYI